MENICHYHELFTCPHPVKIWPPQQPIDCKTRVGTEDNPKSTDIIYESDEDEKGDEDTYRYSRQSFFLANPKSTVNCLDPCDHKSHDVLRAPNVLPNK